MALATSLRRESLARCSRIQASRSATNGALSSCRTALRLSALCLLIARSISNSALIRRTTSSANGEITPGFLPCALRRAFSARSAITKKRTPGVNPTSSFQDRPRPAARLIELAIAAVGVGLEDAAIAGQMSLGMLAGPVARVVEHCARRRLSPERLVVAHIDPDPARVGLAFGQHRNRGVIAVQPLGAQDVGFEALEQRRQCRRTAADLIGQGRQADRHASLA